MSSGLQFVFHSLPTALAEMKLHRIWLCEGTMQTLIFSTSPLAPFRLDLTALALRRRPWSI
jgi:hypothetical protein